MNYPRILVVAIGRINAADTSNNGMLLRNLLAPWPRDHLAQVFSSGENGDPGFCGKSYQLTAADRRFGPFFYRHKAKMLEGGGKLGKEQTSADVPSSSWGRRLLIDGGLYELIFRPRLSPSLLTWARAFRPDFILAQGYNLTFAWLPVFLKEATGARLAFLTTDDWPSSLYSGKCGEPTLFRWLMRRVVERAVRQLMRRVDVPFAFGQPMAAEYGGRYGRPFVTLSHSDDPGRFATAVPRRFHPEGVVSILTTGIFNRFRWPLLLDLEEACRRLQQRGICARVAILATGIEDEGKQAVEKADFLDLFPDPGHYRLPACLKGANLLFLGEGFDSGWVSAIQLSVSSKAHLFMMSRRPILVYGPSETGIAKYAETYGWAATVRNRDLSQLTTTIKVLVEDSIRAGQIVQNAQQTVDLFHLQNKVSKLFLNSLTVA